MTQSKLHESFDRIFFENFWGLLTCRSYGDSLLMMVLNLIDVFFIWASLKYIFCRRQKINKSRKWEFWLWSATWADLLTWAAVKSLYAEVFESSNKYLLKAVNIGDDRYAIIACHVFYTVNPWLQSTFWFHRRYLADIHVYLILMPWSKKIVQLKLHYSSH